MKKNNYLELTEVSGTEVSTEQVLRIYNRYAFSAKFALNKDVLEISCGSGQGSQMLEILAKSYVGIDIDKNLVLLAKKISKNIILLDCMKIDELNKTFDIIIIHEAIYYYSELKKFIQKLNKILRPKGKIIITQPNKYLYDFVPSAKSYKYIGNDEFHNFFDRGIWDINTYGYISMKEVSLRQKILRPIKYFAKKLNLIPTGMSGKFYLKKIYFGSMIKMPSKLTFIDYEYTTPLPISPSTKNKIYKVIYTVLTKK
jgi:SAM-dependent methyltransferase